MASSRLSVVYATDEDIYVAGGADFGVIVPKSNIVAQGTDGSMGVPDLWSLASTSNNFAAQGVTPGMLVEFSGGLFKQSQFLAVETVGTTLGLRRAGMGLGAGVPPLPNASSGLNFKILTLYPQIEDAAFKLNQQFAVDPNIQWRTPGDIYDQRVFRNLIAFRVLYLQYQNLNRTKAGDFADKQDHYQAEYQSELATATLRWGKVGNSQSPSSVFGTRLIR